MRRFLILLAVCAGCGRGPTVVKETAGDLEAPAPPDRGYQISFGPFNVAAGQEVQLCRTLKLPNDQPLAVDRLQVTMKTGSHHFIIFRSEMDYPDQVFPCWGTVNFDEWDFVMDVNRTGGFDWQLKDGQAMIFKPHQQIMIQSHYVNAKTVQSSGGMAYFNLYEATSPVVYPLHGMFTVNPHIKIPPMSTYTTTKKCTPSRDVHIVAMTGHFHARGTLFTVNSMALGDQFSPDTVIAPLYYSDSWDAPVFQLFDPPALVDGLTQALEFSCSYDNQTDATITFGGHADVQEHCNLFFQYYEDVPPEDGSPLRCVEGSGGW
jgi:hypothetical protein